MNAPALSPERFSLPARADGGERRVGVEVEFLGPPPRLAATALARDLGGSVHAEDPHAYHIRGTRLGDLSVETDLRIVHPQRHPHLAKRVGPWGAALFGTITSPFVPRELITAAMGADRLAEMDDVLESLRSVGARGDGAMFLDSLGLHFNIDPPALDARTIAAYLKAYLELDRTLRTRTSQGRWRLALALPADYPDAYKQRVLSPDYWPNLHDLTKDYLAANPTRKRPLDLLPLLAHLNEGQVRSTLPGEKIGRRPAFHYRLPHAHLSIPGWSIAPAWQGWIEVEQLALGKRPVPF